jgi:hypothetical protein
MTNDFLSRAVNRSISIELQYRLFAATPPQSDAQKLQRGIRFYPAAVEQLKIVA